MTEARHYGDLALVARLLRQARGFWLQIAGIALLGLLATPIGLLAPIPLKIAVDSVIGSQPAPPAIEGFLPLGAERGAVLLLLVAILVIVISVLRNGVSLLEWLLSTYTGERLVLRFRAELFAHLQRLSLAYHDTRGSADSVYRIQYSAPAIQHVVIDGLIPLVASITMLVGIFVVTASLDLQLALIAMAVAPVLFGLSRLYSRRLRRRWVRVYDLQSSALAVVQEVLGAVRVVKAFGQEHREQDRFVARSREAVTAQTKVVLVEGGFTLLVGLTTAVGTAAVLFVGVSHVQSGQLTLGGLLMVMAYLAQLYEPLRTVGTKVADLQSSMAGAERAFRLLDEQPEVVDRPNARPIRRARGHIEARNLRFGYEPTHDVLRDVNIDIAPGTRVGISGQTGAGKSTFVNLLCRFYDPTEGSIMLDSVDVRDYRLADLRAQFSIVLQDPVLFPTTIAENIAYARPDAAMRDIVKAAWAANAHDFIVGLPEGYDTLVGERGLRLSGGERQRISIARAFLRDAPILILDEPTSSVDTATEAVIMDAMWRLMAGRTAFMIAHRTSTLDACDRRLRVEDGTIVEWFTRGEDVILRPSLVHHTPTYGVPLSADRGARSAGNAAPRSTPAQGSR